MRYLSRAKLNHGLQAHTEIPGGGGSAFGFGGNVTVRKPDESHQVKHLAKVLDSDNMLTEGRTLPIEGHYALVRFIGRAGTAIAFNEARWRDYADVVWWIGESETFRVCAYGNRTHLMNVGEVPDFKAPENRPTWWPSDVNAMEGLLKQVLEAVRAGEEKPVAVKAGLSITRAFDYMHTVTPKGESFTEHGVYEMLLRVDKVDTPESGPITVMGSPVWVAQNMASTPLPGTYLAPVHLSCSQCTPFITWEYEGMQWQHSNLRISYCSFHQHEFSSNRPNDSELDDVQLPTQPNRKDLVSVNVEHQGSPYIYLSTKPIG